MYQATHLTEANHSEETYIFDPKDKNWREKKKEIIKENLAKFGKTLDDVCENLAIIVDLEERKVLYCVCWGTDLHPKKYSNLEQAFNACCDCKYNLQNQNKCNYEK